VPREIGHHPQLLHRRLFEVEDHPVTGRCAVPGLPIRMSGIESWLRRPSPTLGQHNDEVLLELGYTAAEIDGLRAAGIIGELLAP
jgi:crotonobetainyl-CoA:carnitine CoA-transferase CaiB-like acyl-CoA transferase